MRQALVQTLERSAPGLLRLARAYTARQRERRYQALYAKYQDASMIPHATFVDNLRLVNAFRPIPGCIVECGVWRGGMIAAMAEVLGSQRAYWLCDSFEGLPDPTPAQDGTFSAEKYAEPDWHRCRAGLEEVRAVMARSAVPRVEYVVGWYKDTLPSLRLPEPIAILRLDADWYDSTMQCLEGLYDQVAPGGIVLIDDYHFWEGCTRAVHDFLSQRQATDRLRESSAGVAYIVKGAPRRA